MNEILTVTGMTCSHCEKAVIRAIQMADPQAQVKINRNWNLVEVESTQARAILVKAIAEEGYEVSSCTEPD